jgi:hypothetical protein
VKNKRDALNFFFVGSSKSSIFSSYGLRKQEEKAKKKERTNIEGLTKGSFNRG